MLFCLFDVKHNGMRFPINVVNPIMTHPQFWSMKLAIPDLYYPPWDSFINRMVPLKIGQNLRISFNPMVCPTEYHISHSF